MKLNLSSYFGAFKFDIQLINRYKLVILSLLLFILYFSNNAYVTSGDAIPTILLPWAILEEHTVTLDGFTGFIITHWDNPWFVVLKQGHLVSFYPIVAALLAVPFYLPAYVFTALSGRPVIDFSDSFIFMTGYCMKFASVTIAVLSAVVLYFLLKRLFSEYWAFILTVCYAVCTSTWTISSQSLWQHGPGELLIICCYYLAFRNIDHRQNINILGMGLFSALAFFNRPTDAILLLPAFYYIVKEKCWLYIPAFIVAGSPFLIYNQYYFGTFLGGYINSVTPDIFTVAAATPSVTPVISTPVPITPTSGGLDFGIFPGEILWRPVNFIMVLVMYTPLALLAIPGIINILKQKSTTGIHREILVAMIISILLFIIFFGSLNFSSGWGYGPRYWTDALPILIIFIGMSKTEGTLYNAAFICLALISFMIQAYGAYVFLRAPY